jgi:LCP family protein required for cell wall assembly
MKRAYRDGQNQVLKILFWLIIITGFVVTFLLINKNKTELPAGGSEIAQEGLTLLIAGIDSYELTDTMMLARIDDEKEEVQVVSVPRDLLVFDDRGRPIKINSVFKRARVNGAERDQAMKQLGYYLTRVTGLEFDRYVAIDFQLFIDLIGELEGGVTIDLKDTFLEKRGEFPENRPVYSLDGDEALLYSRDRYSVAGGDLGRARRQQQVVKSVAEEIVGMNLIKDAGRILRIISLYQRYSFTDLNFATMANLYQRYRRIEDYNLYTLVIGKELKNGLLRESFRQTGAGWEYFLEPGAGEENYLQIREEIRNITRQEEYREENQKIREESARVRIYASEDRRGRELTELLQAKGMRASLAESQGLRESLKSISVNPEIYDRYPATIVYLENLLNVRADKDERLSLTDNMVEIVITPGKGTNFP